MFSASIVLKFQLLGGNFGVLKVRKGVPFRETHHISGAAVRLAEDKCCPMSELSVEDLSKLHPLFTEDVAEVFHV